MTMLKFRAPPLPIAGRDYNQDYFAQLIRALTLYFNQLDSLTPVQWQQVTAEEFIGGLFSGEGRGLTLPHIAAQDLNDQYAAANDTPTAIEFGVLDSGSGWTLNAPGSATAQYSGIYKITYSLQFANTDNAIHDATVWLRINGSASSNDVANSTTIFTLQARKSALLPNFVCGYSEVVFSLNAGDSVGLWWGTDQAASSGGATGIYIYHQDAQTTPMAYPATPSALGSITFVSALPA